MNKKNRRNQKLIFGSVRNYLLDQINPLLILPYQITYKERKDRVIWSPVETQEIPPGGVIGIENICVSSLRDEPSSYHHCNRC